MMSSDERYLMVFNGEIFNFKELREELHAEGYDHAQLLLCAAAHLALPAELAELLAKRPTRAGLGYVEPATRLRWRLVVVGAGPLRLLLLGAWRRRRA